MNRKCTCVTFRKLQAQQALCKAVPVFNDPRASKHAIAAAVEAFLFVDCERKKVDDKLDVQRHIMCVKEQTTLWPSVSYTVLCKRVSWCDMTLNRYVLFSSTQRKSFLMSGITAGGTYQERSHRRREATGRNRLFHIFTYMGSKINNTGGTEEYTKARIQKLRMGPHLNRFDVTAAHIYTHRKRYVYNLGRPTSQLERSTFVCKRKRFTSGAAQCQAVM